MKYFLWNLTLELTRKCNIRCAHCMRGNPQNIEITKEIVDQVLDNNDIIAINNLAFSGGEPTLNEDMIVYIIDKIIDNNLEVNNISMVTNGTIYSERIIRALKKFNAYRNKKIIAELKNKLSHHPELLEAEIKENYDNHAIITFSTDQFHGDMEEVIKEYQANAPEFKYYFSGPMKEEDIYKTGRSTMGIEHTYSLKPIRYYEENGVYHTFDYLYITALGNYESEGMGSYKDMDRLNMGSVFARKVEDVLVEYGKPLFATIPLQKKLSLNNQ